MARYAVEMFSQFIYNLELSYHDLLDLEAELKVELAAILADQGGEFVHFEEIGDTVRLQCVFADYEEAVFHTVCERIAPLMDGRVESRLLFVNKDLDLLYIYTISNGDWRECCLHLPAPGPLAKALLNKKASAKKRAGGKSSRASSAGKTPGKRLPQKPLSDN
ncbi:MAG: hypothetical protein LBN33_03070 [Desulfovibrio sp.]|jgi:hypothetical protein|nr:hypothetical protein [Desulfovibrio sp.]